MANEFQQAPQQGYQQPQQGYQQPQQGYQQPQQPGFQQPQQQFNNMFNQGGGTPMMQFPEAVQRGIAGILNFKGRARRSEFWWFALAVGVCTFILRIIFGMFGNGLGITVITGLISLAGTFAMTGVMIRRLQDTNKPGILAWILLGLYVIIFLLSIVAAIKANSDPFGALAFLGYLTIPTALYIILGIVVLVFCCLDSNKGPNPHGPSEKYPM